MPRGGSRGRICPHERDTNNDAPILGADIEVQDQHSSSVRETERHDATVKVKREHRNRIKQVYEFWKTEYPEYFSVGVTELTEAELGDEDKFWWKNKHDLVYEGMNVKMVTAFLASKKEKSNGKKSSYDNLRKYHDAILYGAKQAGKRLPQSYYEEVEKFIKGYKKEAVKARSEGNLDEKEADPISWSLFLNMLNWALVGEKNVFLWVFSLLQWHCMARSINIGGMALHCFRQGKDNVICKYDKQKADQTGEKVHDKHLYDNPFNALVSLFTALGVWFSLSGSHFKETEMLFQTEDNGPSAASSRYCTQLCELFAKYKEQLKQYIRVDHANTHGVRKGSATTASSGTTCLPPVSSIAARGEWSLGRILDLYWHFAEPGDTYLGRVLAGLDPNSDEFGTLPPHWKLDDPMSNDKIKEGMNLMFATILQKWGNTAVDPTGLLVLCLASVVWHSDFLKETAAADPEHPFNAIPLLSSPQLLNDLKELVTLEPEGHVKQATGIPPHVQHAKTAKEILTACLATLEAVKGMVDEVKKAVCDAIEDKAEENGQVTGQRLKQILEAHQTSIVELITEKISELRTEIQSQTLTGAAQEQDVLDDDAMPFADGAEDEEVQNQQGQPQVRYRTYVHHGRYWQVPADFAFPTSVNLETVWKIWIQGLPGNETIDTNGNRQQAPVRPVRKMKLNMLPKSVKKSYQLHWRPIFSLMEQAPGIQIDGDLDAESILTSYEAGKEFLKTRVGYVFQKQNAKPMEWQISTWSKMVAYSSIRKNGTDQDKANLPPENVHRNKSRQQHGRTKPQADRRRVHRRDPQTNRTGRSRSRTSTRARVDEEGELPDLRHRLSEVNRARLYETDHQQAAEEIAAAAREELEEERRANRFGVAAGDGTTIHVGPQFPLQDPLQDLCGL